MTDTLILTGVVDRVGTITLNAPDRLNAYSLGLAERFIEAMDAFRGDKEVRAIVVRGAGRVFSVGGDVKAMMGHVKEGRDRAAYFRAPLAAYHRMVVAIRQMPKPVVAAVHGAVAGVAFNTALACDFIVAREGTRFMQAFIRLGVSPDGGGTFYLPRRVGHARACELTMLPTELDAEKALAWGLINRVVPAGRFDEEVAALAGQLTRGPAKALARTKALLNREQDAGLAGHLELERLAQVDNAGSPDFDVGLAAFLEKREPAFKDG